MIEALQERPEIKKIRDEFISNLPKVLNGIARFLKLEKMNCLKLLQSMQTKIKLRLNNLVKTP